MEQYRFHPRHDGARPTQTRRRNALDEAHEPQQDSAIHPVLPQLHVYHILSPLDTVSTLGRTLEPSPQRKMLEPINPYQLLPLHRL